MSLKKVKKINPPLLVLIGFFSVIILGSLLLYLPVSSAGVKIKYIDALFTAVTSTCVTGLVTVPTVSTYSTFGHIVILLLIQIGGLGVITVISGFLISFNKKLGFSDRLIIQESFNLNTFSGIVKFVRKVVIGTFTVEGIGALCYMTVFIPQFGLKGIWISVFNSVSAFCNAGIDIISQNSLVDYYNNPIINIVTELLIIFGGLGFIVWWDLIRVIKDKFKNHKLKVFKRLTLQSKLVIISTLFFIISGAVLIFAAEYNNDLTIGKFSLWDKIQASIFQSVTTRTAGFATIPQQNLSNAASAVCLLLMFIGGSPVGTAGGIKTVTIAVIFLAAKAVINGKKDVCAFGRKISETAVRKAAAVFFFLFATVFVSTVFLSFLCNADFLDIVFETVSAAATVGLSRNLTSTLQWAAKLVLCFTMYFGRVGPISIAVAFGKKAKNGNSVKDPAEELNIG